MNNMNIKKCVLTFFALVCLSTVCAYAQTQQIFRSGKGISSNMINHIMCDRNGLVWICTDNGINRMDGARNTYIYGSQDKNSCFVYAFHDSQDRYWFCGNSSNYLYDDDKEAMTVIDVYTNKGEKLSSSTRMVLEVEKGKAANAAGGILCKGNILACSTGHGVLILKETKGQKVFQQVKSLIPYYYISHMAEDKDGNLWMCTEKGIQVFDGRKCHRVACGDDSRQKQFSFITMGDDGNIWCGNNAGGTWRINPKTRHATEVQALHDFGVHCVLAHRKNGVLVATNSAGIWEVKSNTLETAPLKIVFDNITDNRLNVHSLGDDINGNLWIGCYQKGVVVLPRQENRFSYIGRHSIDQNLIGNCCVMSLGSDSNGRMWVAANGDGMYGLSALGGAKNSQLRFTSSHISPVVTGDGQGMPRTVMTQYCDSKGHLWLGAWMQGLWVMDTETGKAHSVALPTSSTSFSVFAITEDSYGKLWIGTLGEGLFSLDLTTGEVKEAPKVANGLKYRQSLNIIPNNWINGFCKGKGDIMFLATCDGIGAFNVKTGDCLKTFRGKNRLFGGDNVNTVCYTDDDHLWVGTNHGMYRLNLKTLEYKLYNSNDGLLGNMVQAILNDRRGGLWISTNQGLSHLNLKDLRVVNYSSNDGMFGNEFSRNAAVVDASGNLWFGGTEGICCFSPEKVVTSSEKPRMCITGLYVAGQRVNAASESGGSQILASNIMDAQRIELSSSDNSITLELSSLNYIRNSDVAYEYRLDKGEWQRLPIGTNTVSFSNLESGTHEIVFRAVDQGEYSDERILEVRIRSPWYATWWAYFIYLLLLLAIAYAVQRNIRQRQVHNMRILQNRQQEEMNEAKLQFFMNLSHEIRTPMALILSPLQRLMDNDADTERQSAYHRMNRNAQRILQLVNQMLDIRKIDKGQMKLYFREVEMVSFLDGLVDSFHDLCDTKKISIRFLSDADALKAWVDPMNFEKIISNLLSNAFKYTPEKGHVTVSLSIKDKNYSIRVEDDGEGLSAETIKHVFDRFYQANNAVNATAQSLGDARKVIQGSGIGLNLTHSLVEMHHGTITCANNENGKGCHFIVTMPLGKPSDDEIVQTAPDESLTVKPVGTRKHILVVEDDDEIRRYLKDELSREFLVTQCTNGQEALGMLHKRNDIELVITDVVMPVMNGMEMLRQIRQNTTMNSIPVILLSGKSTDQDQIEGLSAGADAYIAKPFNIEVVRRTAKNIVQRREQLKNIFNGRQSPVVEKKIKVLSPDEKLMQRIMKVINANIDNPNLGNDLITKEVGISRVHLYRKLKELTNLSLRDFIRNIRLDEAARLLKEQKHSIAEVATRTGFENVSYFTVIFKQKFGVPPSRYHEQQLMEHEQNDVEHESTDV